jgi:hypothetical protein
LRPSESADKSWSPIVELHSWRHYSFAAVLQTKAQDTASFLQLHHGEKQGRTGPCPSLKSTSDKRSSSTAPVKRPRRQTPDSRHELEEAEAERNCHRRRPGDEPYLGSCVALSSSPHLSPSMGAPPCREEEQHKVGSGPGDPTLNSGGEPYLERCMTSPAPPAPPPATSEMHRRRRIHGAADLTAEIRRPTLKSHLGILYTKSTPMTTTGTIPSLPLHGHAGERSSGPARISREEDQAGGTRETEEGEGNRPV